ncbi:type II toxin-antitoxin system VapC family toxin [uncultured Methanobrevibacter sp.]|uniref:type II toxin-antitoxin system VapC family toxin n=1 Tax=uncultured Methanobrevibacter sp. TaxID=253161 RepID=UPI0026DFE5EC|nr:type II toxin-antitoxin system VapC family toxin [uncultured Methanobrevibacter sp.]
MKYFLDTSFILAIVLDSDSNYKKAVNLAYVLNEKCYINNNVLNEVLTLIGRKLDINSAKELYYNIIDSFELLNEYDISNYNSENFNIFEKYVGENSKKSKLSFTDSSIILTMKEYNIPNLVSFDKEFKKVKGINLIK